MPTSLFVALPSNRSAAPEEETLRARIVDNFLHPTLCDFSFKTYPYIAEGITSQSMEEYKYIEINRTVHTLRFFF